MVSLPLGIAGVGMSADWSSLPGDIWSLIIEKLPLEAYIRCGSVCLQWSLIFGDLKQFNFGHQIPWLVQAPECKESSQWRFFDIACNKMHKIDLPELRYVMILGSGGGWLIVADKKTADIRLFNPFTRDKILLPPTTTFANIVGVDRDFRGQISQYHAEMGWGGHLRKLKPSALIREYLISALVTSSDCGFIVVVRHEYYRSSFARSGDKTWTPLEQASSAYCRCTLFKNQLYEEAHNGSVISFDLSGNGLPPPPLEVAPRLTRLLRKARYLVMLPESGELLLLGWPGRKFEVFSLDQNAMKWIQVKSLGSHSLFGLSEFNNCSMICLSAKDRLELQANCIYYIEENAVKILDMKDQSIKTYQIGKECSPNRWFGREHVWITPVLVSLT